MSLLKINNTLVKLYDDLNDQSYDHYNKKGSQKKSRFHHILNACLTSMAARVIACATAIFNLLIAAKNLINICRAMMSISGIINLFREFNVFSIEEGINRIISFKFSPSAIQFKKHMAGVGANLLGIVSPSTAAKLCDKIGLSHIYKDKINAAKKAQKVFEKKINQHFWNHKDLFIIDIDNKLKLEQLRQNLEDDDLPPEQNLSTEDTTSSINNLVETCCKKGLKVKVLTEKEPQLQQEVRAAKLKSEKCKRNLHLNDIYSYFFKDKIPAILKEGPFITDLNFLFKQSE
jgi:hypothetical protein